MVAGTHANGSDQEFVDWEVDRDIQEEADHEQVVGVTGVRITNNQYNIY